MNPHSRRGLGRATLRHFCGEIAELFAKAIFVVASPLPAQHTRGQQTPRVEQTRPKGATEDQCPNDHRTAEQAARPAQQLGPRAGTNLAGLLDIGQGVALGSLELVGKAVHHQTTVGDDFMSKLARRLAGCLMEGSRGEGDMGLDLSARDVHSGKF